MGNVVAVIPARGGSKGIPGKNLKEINGLSLVARSVIATTRCKNIDAVYVSSDSDNILDEGKRYGALEHKRSGEAAADTASTEDALDDFLDRFPNSEKPEVLVYLQCTSPFLDPEELENAISYLADNPEIDTVFSAKPFHGFLWQNVVGSNKSTGINHTFEQGRARRQDLVGEQLLEDGAFYVLRVSSYVSTHNRFGKNPYAFRSSVQPYTEIDAIDDLEIARLVHSFFDDRYLISDK